MALADSPEYRYTCISFFLAPERPFITLKKMFEFAKNSRYSGSAYSMMWGVDMDDGRFHKYTLLLGVYVVMEALAGYRSSKSFGLFCQALWRNDSCSFCDLCFS